MTRQPRRPAGSGQTRPSGAIPPLADERDPDAARDTQRWIGEMLASRRMGRVAPNMNRAGELVNQARTHLRSALDLADSDPTGAVDLLHTAVRKALDAHAGARGYRFENTPGGHRATLEYGTRALAGTVDDSDFQEADALRARRHQADYEGIAAARISRQEIEHHANVAERIVAAVAADLAGPASADPTETSP